MFGKEFLSAEKASAEFRTPLWEILATPLMNSTEFFPTGYTLFQKDRSDGYGGVLLAFKESLTVAEYQIDNPNSCELIAYSLKYENQKVILCSTYRPPS